MNKLRLSPEELRVESFETARKSGAAGKGAGTVHAAAGFTAYGNFTCAPNWTCPECAQPDTDVTCNGCTQSCRC